MIASSTSLGRLFLCLISIAVKIFPHFNSNLPYYLFISRLYSRWEKEILKFQKMFQDSRQFHKKYILQQNPAMATFFFFCSPDQEIYKHINKLAGNKHTLSSIPDRRKRSAPIPSLSDKSICCRRTTNDLTALPTDTVSAFFQICLLRSWLLV